MTIAALIAAEAPREHQRIILAAARDMRRENIPFTKALARRHPKRETCLWLSQRLRGGKK